MPTVRDGDRILSMLTRLLARARLVALVVVLGLVAAGCQVIPGDGPWLNDASSRSTEALPFDVIDLTPTTVVAYRPPVQYTLGV